MSLFASMNAARSALEAVERGLSATQNNVANASTPGFAKQRVAFEAMAFDGRGGLAGGVTTGGLESSRSEYADREVRRQLSLLGAAEGRAEHVSRIENAFDVTGTSGVPAALDKLYQSFSAWGVETSDISSRQAVIQSASELAAAFRQASSAIAAESAGAERDINETVAQVNQLATKLAKLNASARRSGQMDAGADAQASAALEELAELTDITAARNEDGTITVLLGGEIPLVMGDTAHAVSARRAASSSDAAFDGPPPIEIVDEQGISVEGKIRGGRLAGLLSVRNEVIPSLTGDGNQQGDLNRLAGAVADRVNQLLTGGVMEDGSSGAPLFSYDSSHSTAIAASLRVDSGITPGKLAPIDPGPPQVANGVALDLAALAEGNADEDTVDGWSYTEFYANVSGRIGREVQASKADVTAGATAAAQAKALREGISGVSLDEEAVRLIELQRSYQAAAQMVSVLSELTEVAIGIVR
jgi:flagellar hook-associated protein 1 FlgK